jgi:TetR/AcrR family transcriptional repressor of multidrug resistance operon
MRTRDIAKESLVKQKAIELLGRGGFEDFSMNKLSRECCISVATLYIYYKDKEDLILKIAEEEVKRMSDALLENFDPEYEFEKGLRIQWQNRFKYMMENPEAGMFFDQLRNSSFQQKFLDSFLEDFRESVGKFMHNAVRRGEINKWPLEVYWSIAFSPLYALIRFHQQKKSLGGKPFKISDKILWETFDLVIKALIISKK